MNEREVGHRVALHLSAAARDLDPYMAKRLRDAREQALRAKRPAGLMERIHAVLDVLRVGVSPMVQSAAVIIALLAVLLVGDHYTTESRLNSNQELDAALLMDDLPIDAYLDTDFKTWLLQNSQS